MVILTYQSAFESVINVNRSVTSVLNHCSCFDTFASHDIKRALETHKAYTPTSRREKSILLIH